MFRVVLSVLAASVLLGSPAGIAAGEPRQAQPSGGMTGASATASPRPVTKPPAREPAALSGMLAAQNDSRSRMGVPGLVWSAELSAKAEATVKAVAASTCSQSATQRIGREGNAAIYWVAGLRRLGGRDAAQDISPAYLVSRWREAQGDYDAATGMCRTKTPACDPYARMVAPKAKSVGCAKTVCTNQAQVWACHYSE